MSIDGSRRQRFQMPPGPARTAVCYIAPWSALIITWAVCYYVFDWGIWAMVGAMFASARVHTWTIGL